MTLAAALAGAITLLSNAPAAFSALEALYNVIKNHTALTDAEKTDLLAQAKAAMDAADDRLQSLPSTDPKLQPA